MGETLLELKHITQDYTSGRRTFTAVKDINLALNTGNYMALLGPSGCGKSTLLRIMIGLQRPSNGQVLYRGQPLQGVNPRAAIVFQTFALFPWLTVQDNVEVALQAHGMPERLRTTRALDLLDRVGLDGFETAYPRELSGGMRQKVGFARAMAVEPEMLCLDEPFSALDVLSAESLRGELLELWTSGKIPTQAILMVTHNIEEAVFMADRIMVMDKDPGRVVAEMKVELPHPRQRKSDAFLAYVDRAYELLAGQTQPEQVEMGSAPGEPGRTRGLPHIIINDLAGMLENLNEMPNNRHDIYKLADELRIDSDHLPDGRGRAAGICDDFERRRGFNPAGGNVCGSQYYRAQGDLCNAHPPPAFDQMAAGNAQGIRPAPPGKRCLADRPGIGIPTGRS